MEDHSHSCFCVVLFLSVRIILLVLGLIVFLPFTIIVVLLFACKQSPQVQRYKRRYGRAVVRVRGCGVASNTLTHRLPPLWAWFPIACVCVSLIASAAHVSVCPHSRCAVCRVPFAVCRVLCAVCCVRVCGVSSIYRCRYLYYIYTYIIFTSLLTDAPVPRELLGRRCLAVNFSKIKTRYLKMDPNSPLLYPGIQED